MPISFSDRLKFAWNVFRYGEFYQPPPSDTGVGYSVRPDRNRLRVGTERSIISSIYTRIGIDVSSNFIKHVRLDENERFIDEMPTGLNNCLTLEANIDQTARAFIQDVVMSLCDEGCVAIVPIDTTINPNVTGSYDIITMRTGKIVEWYPEKVRVSVFNQQRGMKQEVTLSKTTVAIVENPLYAVMNEPNSTLQRLITKLNLLDAVDQQSGSGKLDLIIQLPFVIKTQTRKDQAEIRRKDIEDQLAGSKYGIAYTDATERITQLNRPAENNLMKQIEYLTNMLYNQLGLTAAVFDGTADEKTMMNYYVRTIEPILSAITDSMKRVFITKTGRTQGQSIIHIRDPFKFVPTSELAKVADTFTRNEILSSNEVRAVIGYKPSKEEGADKLQNKNLNEKPNSNLSETNSETNQNERTELVNVENKV